MSLDEGNVTIESNNNENNISKNISYDISDKVGTSASKIYAEESNTQEEIKKLCFCQNPGCRSPVKIKFINFEQLNIRCIKEWKSISLNEFIASYIKDVKISSIKDEKIYNFYCMRHENIDYIKKFDRYCENCKFDLCKECSFLPNCENHDYINLILEDEKRVFLEGYIENNSQAQNENTKKICELIEALLNTNKEFPNVRTFKSLENVYKLLSKDDKEDKNNNDIFIIKTGKIINEWKDFKSNIITEKLYKIDMNEKNFRALQLLYRVLTKNKNLASFVKLVLSGNNLSSIKPLLYANSRSIFTNLIHLDLARNNLGDENIEYIRKLKCENLKYLYLNRNLFHDYTIFNEVSKNFGSHLLLFYIGFNRFSKNIEKLGKCEFPKLESIGLNYVFGEKNVEENLKKFKMENLQQLFIQNNGINSFSFLKDMNLPKIQEIYLENNETEGIDIENFLKFSTLKKIFLGNSFTKIINFKKISDLKMFEYIQVNDYKINIDIIGKNGINLIKDVQIKL